MDLQDATLDYVEAIVVSKLLEGVGFVSVHLERHALNCRRWASVRGADPLAAALSRVSRRHGGDGGRLQHQGGPAAGKVVTPAAQHPSPPPATQPLSPA